MMELPAGKAEACLEIVWQERFAPHNAISRAWAMAGCVPAIQLPRAAVAPAFTHAFASPAAQAAMKNGNFTVAWP